MPPLLACLLAGYHRFLDGAPGVWLALSHESTALTGMYGYKLGQARMNAT